MPDDPHADMQYRDERLGLPEDDEEERTVDVEFIRERLAEELGEEPTPAQLAAEIEADREAD